MPATKDKLTSLCEAGARRHVKKCVIAVPLTDPPAKLRRLGKPHMQRA